MQTEKPYTRLEIDLKFDAVHKRFDDQDVTLKQILVQSKMHNGRLNKLERVLLVVGTAVLVLLITNGSSLVEFAQALVK